MELKHQPALLRLDLHPGPRWTRFGGAAVPQRQAVHLSHSTGAAGGVGARCHTSPVSFPGEKAQLCLREGEEEVFRCSRGAGEGQICIDVASAGWEALEMFSCQVYPLLGWSFVLLIT